MSSDSKSKRRRSGSSRKKKSSSRDKLRSKSGLRPVETDTDLDDKTNLVALVMGMVTTMVLVFGVFGFGSDQIVNEKYDAEQDRRKSAIREANRADTLEELTIKLTELGSAKLSGFNDSANNCNERIAISKEILSRGPSSENMRQRAVCEGILAHIKLYGLDFTEDLKLENVAENLEAAYSPYLDDENLEIYQNARVALLTHQSFEQLKSESATEDTTELVELFSDTIERFPDSKYVTSMIEAHLLVLIQTDSRYAGNLFVKLREINPVGSLQPEAEDAMRNISDRLTLKKESFDRKYADRWANGMAGRRELVKSSIRLLNEQGVGQHLIRMLNQLAEWFERNEFFEEARSVYEEFIAAADRGNIVAEHAAFAKTVATNGLRRVALQGNLIEYRGVDSNGKPLIDAELKKEIAIVLFWSIKSQESLRYLVDINDGARTFGNKPVSIFAVCVDSELPTVVKQMRTSRLVRIVEPEFESGSNSLLNQCPPGTLPHLMLIGFGGKVVDVNVEPLQIKNKAMKLLLDRNR